MNEAWAAVGITAWVVGSAWLATVAARDMDARGRNGKLYGLSVLIFWPLGLPAWFVGRRSDTDIFLYGELLLVALVTFPLSLIAWLVIFRPWERLRRV